jgi:membrane associated rhomboid family serine protease
MSNNGLNQVKENLYFVLLMLGVLWAAYFLTFLPFNHYKLGIRPRQLWGLIGIATSPLIHANFFHLLFNSIPLSILLFISLSYSRNLTLVAIILIAFFGGMGVWLTAMPNSIHIGASGIVFGLMGFLIGIGYFRKEIMAPLISLFILFTYGGSILFLLVPIPGISWTGHFFGLTAGFLAAYMTRNEKREE